MNSDGVFFIIFIIFLMAMTILNILKKKFKTRLTNKEFIFYIRIFDLAFIIFMLTSTLLILWEGWRCVMYITSLL